MSSIARPSAAPRPRRAFYIDPELQLPIVLMLALLVTAEAFFVGYGFYRAIELSREWRRPDQALDVFGTLALVVVPTVAFNLLAGVLFSHRLAGPADKLRRAMEDVARGDLDGRVSLRRDDLLQSWAVGFNAMVGGLRAALDRDRRHVLRASRLLALCSDRLEKERAITAADCARLRRMMAQAKRRLAALAARRA